jgi:hypothetical protein
MGLPPLITKEEKLEIERRTRPLWPAEYDDKRRPDWAERVSDFYLKWALREAALRYRLRRKRAAAARRRRRQVVIDELRKNSPD